MAGWSAFAAEVPELAAAGWRLLSVPGVGFGYLATVRSDGWPRVHPVNPFIVGDELGIFLVPSPKLDDLRHDGRCALHSCGTAEVDDEFFLSARASISQDHALRAAAVAGYHGPVPDAHVLVTLDIERALLARYTTPPTWPPAYTRWPLPGAAPAP